MRRTRSRHVGRSVLSGATTPNRNGLVIAWNPRTRAMSGPVTRHAATCDLLSTPSDAAATPLARRDGGWLTEVDAPEGPRIAVLFVHAVGDEWVPHHEREAHAAAYGEASARLHNACDDFACDQPRFALDLVHPLDRPLATFEPFLRDRPDDDRYLRADRAFARSGRGGGQRPAVAGLPRRPPLRQHAPPAGREPGLLRLRLLRDGVRRLRDRGLPLGAGFGEPNKPDQRWERFLEG